ncbi:MAG: thiamine pyrophosphate-dependent enzyme [Candidatus Roizmanbacteria bacterium]
MSTIQDFTGYAPTWCPGCGNWAIGISIKTALSQLGYSPSDVMIAFDIGCSGNMNDFVNAYATHGLHGRSLPVAIGAKLANHKMPVLAVGGDGGLYGEGGNHFLHACRGNHDITMIVHDNSVYGLTTGQVAPTAQKGYKSKSTPTGALEVAVNPLTLALTQGATFIGQSFAGDITHLIDILKKAIQHKGFSLVNILQPCVTFNKVYTYQYYLKRSYKLPETYDKGNLQEAFATCEELNHEKFALGVLYEIERPSFHEQLSQLSATPLIDRSPYKGVSEILQQFI